MSLTLQAVLTNRYPASFSLSFSRIHFLKSFVLSPHNSKTHLPDYRFFSSYHYLPPLTRINASFEEPHGNSQKRGSESGTTFAGSNFDSFLSILEFLSLASSAAISLYVALSNGAQKRELLNWVGTKILVWQCVVLISGVVVGAVLRRRQWMIISGARFSRGSSSTGFSLSERVDKMEEDVRNVATIIRVLSRQLEKLGIRFRITRKALKEPIEQVEKQGIEEYNEGREMTRIRKGAETNNHQSYSRGGDMVIQWLGSEENKAETVLMVVETGLKYITAALAQKNSEATQSLAAQEDNLEKELGEIQKVLLAMQEQQQKQLELILAIGKSGKLWDTKHTNNRDGNAASKASKASVEGKPNLKINQTKAMTFKEINNDIA